MEEVGFKDRLGQTLDCRKHSKRIFPSGVLKTGSGSEKRKRRAPEGECAGSQTPQRKETGGPGLNPVETRDASQEGHRGSEPPWLGRGKQR